MPVDIVRDTAIDVLLRVFDRGVFLDVSLNKSIQRKQLSERGRRFLPSWYTGLFGMCVYATMYSKVLSTSP